MRNTALNEVFNLAKSNKSILFIGSDLGAGTLKNMSIDLPDQFIMEGISEQHIIGMAAGLAMEGFIPYVNSIAPFLTRRCYEQVLIDICLHDLPVRLLANGGGVVYAPLGPTHLAVEDIAILRAIPNMSIVAPCDADEMKRLISQSEKYPHPLYIRFAKGGEKVISQESSNFKIGKGIVLKSPNEGLFITTGVMSQKAMEAVSILLKKGVSCGVLHLHTIKPLDTELVLDLVSKVNAIVIAEEHIINGGLSSAILEICSDNIPMETHKISRIGIPDKFSDKYGSQDELLSYWGITAENLALQMEKKLNEY